MPLSATTGSAPVASGAVEFVNRHPRPAGLRRLTSSEAGPGVPALRSTGGRRRCRASLFTVLVVPVRLSSFGVATGVVGEGAPPLRGAGRG